MSIQGIRYIQIICQACLAIGLFSFLTVLLINPHRLPVSPRILLDIAMAGGVAGGLLLLVLGQLRCPVCRFRFTGRESKSYFTPTCRNCGRRAGDHS